MHHHIPANRSGVQALFPIFDVSCQRPEEGRIALSTMSRRIQIFFQKPDGARMRWDITNFPAFAVNRQVLDPFAVPVILDPQITEFSTPDRMDPSLSESPESLRDTDRCPSAMSPSFVL
jgi:hypothetical protein